MKKKILTACFITASLFCMTGCSEADRVSYNISKQADNFNVLRQLTVINNITGDTIFTMTGKFSLYVDTAESQLEVTVENDDGTYSKHFVGLNDVTTYTIVDLDENYVDKYHFTINYNPNLWIPADIETID
jgi:hypothetical protein